MTNETSPDFNLMTADECGNPFTFITKIEEYQRTFRVGFPSVMEINKFIKDVGEQIKRLSNVDAVIKKTAYVAVFIKVPKANAAKAPVCAEINELRAIQFHEDIYCRWRNVVFNCSNLLPNSENNIKEDTLMALYYASFDQAKASAIPCLTKQQQIAGYPM